MTTAALIHYGPHLGDSYRPDDGEEVPVWKKQLSFRGQPYRYAHHQNGVMGHLQASCVCVCVKRARVLCVCAAVGCRQLRSFGVSADDLTSNSKGGLDFYVHKIRLDDSALLSHVLPLSLTPHVPPKRNSSLAPRYLFGWVPKIGALICIQSPLYTSIAFNAVLSFHVSRMVWMLSYPLSRCVLPLLANCPASLFSPSSCFVLLLLLSVL